MMRLFACAALACLLAFSSVGLGQTPSRPVERPLTPAAARAEAALRDLAADIREARLMLDRAADRRTRERIETLLLRAETQANQLRKDLALATAPAAPAVPQPASAEDFATVLKGLKAERFDDGRLAFLELAVSKRYLSSAQVRTLLSEFAFDEGRLKTALLVHPRVSDPENFFTVLDTFKFSSSKEELRSKLKGK